MALRAGERKYGQEATAGDFDEVLGDGGIEALDADIESVRQGAADAIIKRQRRGGGGIRGWGGRGGRRRILRAGRQAGAGEETGGEKQAKTVQHGEGRFRKTGRRERDRKQLTGSKQTHPPDGAQDIEAGRHRP